jgi:hypothetical protein
MAKFSFKKLHDTARFITYVRQHAVFNFYTLISVMPPLEIAYDVSLSGTSGESYIFATRSSPRPLRKYKRVADLQGMCERVW